MLLADLPKTLIFGSSYIPTAERREEVLLWSRVNKYLNPHCDTLLVDSASPFDPTYFARDVGTIARQPDNLGHPTHGEDGWGRDFCLGIDYAIHNAYEWCVFIESDLIFAQPVLPIISRLSRIGVLCAAPMNFHYQFIETGLMFMSVRYLAATNFTGRYRALRHTPGDFCERKCEALFGEEFMALPLRGTRNDFNLLNRENFSQAFPHGVDFLTHCSDHELYRLLLASNKVDIR